MAVETELKLALAPSIAKRLSAHPLLATQMPQRLQLSNTYYDTPDRRLQKKGMAVRFRQKDGEWLLTVKCDAASPGGLARRSEWEGAAQPGQFDFALVDNAKIRRFLESLRGELRPLFSTEFARDRWLLTPQAGRCIEVALDRGKIIAGKRQETICEVEIELLEGKVADLFEVALALQDNLELHPQSSSKAERGYQLATAAGLVPVKAGQAAIDVTATVLAAYRSTVFACLAHLQGNERGLRESSAPEFTHQARVAIRRLRSAIRLWRPLLPAAYVANFAPRWRSVASRLGDARNWDVFVAEFMPPLLKTFPAHPALQALNDYAKEQLSAAHKASKAAMRARAYSQLLLEFTQATLALPETRKPSLLKFAPCCLDKCAQKVAGLAQSSRDTHPEARHDLRVALKRLRYAAEFFTPLLPSRRLSSYLEHAGDLLDLLGRLNDLTVAEQLINAASKLPSSDLALGWLAGRNDLLLGELDASLDKFLGHRPPWETR